MTTTPDCDVTFVVRAFDDEECVGHCLRRIADYVRAHHWRAEILLADEGSGDNTVAVAVMLRRQIREIAIVHAAPGYGWHDGCQRARGRIVICADAGTDAPLAALGYALGRLDQGRDVVALGGRYLVFRRTLAWRALPALIGRRDFATVQRRFVRRARALGLGCAVTKRPSRPVWRRLISAFRPHTTA